MVLKDRTPISVIVPSGNRRDVIEDCLQSVRWADEVIVVDSFATDGSLEIARRYADRVLQHEYGSSALQKNWAIPQAAHEWVLIVDTDERVPRSLREEIEQLLRSPQTHAGYRVPRVNYFLGRTITKGGYYPDYQTRLFQRDKGRYDLRRVHAHMILNGTCGTLHSPLIHYAHRSLDQTLTSLLIQMTAWEAQQRASDLQGRTASLLVDLVLRPPAAFALRYFVHGAWKEGWHGFAVSLLWTMYVAITQLRVWESNLGLSQGWWIEDWQKQQKKA